MDSLNSGHGRIWPRPDGRRARCGGPGMCHECREDQAKVLIIQIFASGAEPRQYVVFQDDPRALNLIHYLNQNTIRC